MRRLIVVGCLSLIGGAAAAQTAPTPQPPPNPPIAQTMPPQISAAPGAQAADGTQAGAPEGEIIETPSGLFLVRPGQRPMPLDVRPPPGAPAPGSLASSDMDPDDQGPPPLRPPHPPHPRPEGRGARFRIQTPALTLGVSCPEAEPMKACVDAISGLLDKAAPQPHS